MLVEAAAIQDRRQQATLSSNLQALVCRPVIRTVTLAGWGAFSIWFADHIWR